MSGYAAYGPASQPKGTPWGNGPSGDGPQPFHGWGPPGWHYCGPNRLLAIALAIFGFMLWWPIGLVVLAFTFGRKYMGCSSGFHDARREWREQRRAWKRGWYNFAGGNQGSGNRAFDEYRAETLRRLEEEQQEFSSFLDRLRFAKDKAEFDAFMAERRRGAEPPPPDAHPA